MTIADPVAGIVLPSLPFVLAFALQLLGQFARITASTAFDRERALPSGSSAVSGSLRTVAIDAAVVTHRTLSFFLSLLAATSSSVIYLLRSGQPILAIVPALVFPAMLAGWGLRWQHFTHAQMMSEEGRTMRIASYAQIIVLWALTLFAQ